MNENFNLGPTDYLYINGDDFQNEKYKKNVIIIIGYDDDDDVCIEPKLAGYVFFFTFSNSKCKRERGREQN